MITITPRNIFDSYTIHSQAHFYFRPGEQLLRIPNMLYSRIILFLGLAMSVAAAPIAEGDGATTQDCKRETGDDRDADMFYMTGC